MPSHYVIMELSYIPYVAAVPNCAALRMLGTSAWTQLLRSCPEAAARAARCLLPLPARYRAAAQQLPAAMEEAKKLLGPCTGGTGCQKQPGSCWAPGHILRQASSSGSCPGAAGHWLAGCCWMPAAAASLPHHTTSGAQAVRRAQRNLPSNGWAGTGQLQLQLATPARRPIAGAR
jgi:hypothetical protein